MNTTPWDWADGHRRLGHDAVTTVIAAPGYGTGSYCYTCKEHGPQFGGILSPEDVR